MLISCRAAVAFGLLLTLIAPRASWAVEIDILSKVIGADSAASVMDPLGIEPDEIAEAYRWGWELEWISC